MPSEMELIEQCLVGNLDAYRRLIEPYQAFVLRVSLSVLGNREEAEEAAQDAFVRAYNGLAKYKSDGPFQAWLYRIAMRTSLNAHRSRKRRRIFERLVDPTGFDQVASSGAENPETQSIHRETREKVRRMIDSLPRKLHEVVVLSYLEEFSVREIAQMLDIPQGTVKSRLHLARKRLAAIAEDLTD
jgi:RNA polymerase sigma-70 factor (ECF subfamily)